MEEATKKPFWIFLFCAFVQVILFLFIYSVGWSIIDHYYHPGNKFDWGLTFLVATYAFFIATSLQWLILFFTKGQFLGPISALVFISLAVFVYTSSYPWRYLFLLACLLAAILFATFVFNRLIKLKKNRLTGTPDAVSSNVLDDDWE